MSFRLKTLKALAEEDGISQVSGWKRVKSGAYIKFTLERKQRKGNKGEFRTVSGYIRKYDLINLLIKEPKNAKQNNLK